MNKNRIASSLLSATIYGCGSNISGNYSGDGYYMYPFYTLNFDTSPQDTKVNTTVYSADVPNRFNIYDSLGSLVAYTQWMGNVTYPGPWGTSLNTPQTQTISFTTKTKGPYSLKVETVTQGYSDSWTASLSCTIDTSYKNSANPYDNAGALHNLLLDYFKTNTTLPLSNGSKIIYTFDKYFKIYGSASVASKSVLPATQLSFTHQFENSSDHYTFLVQGNYMSQAGVNYYKKLDSVIDANSIMSSLYSSIKSIECQILASSLIQKEKNTLLEAASIGRYSSYYWSIPSNQSKWNINTSITGKFSWGSLGKADLKGGIEGGVAGAIIGGVVATPIVSVPSWIAGAVSWGAGCSVSNAIGQVSGCW
ncbi:MAG: hypothetical protein H7320_16455 [Ferruginibacter sp.]|nr:hypothetical protein [Ferruginibacter sp.]